MMIDSIPIFPFSVALYLQLRNTARGSSGMEDYISVSSLHKSLE